MNTETRRPLPSRARGQTGALMVELIVAMGIVVVALLPLAYSIASERRLALAYYHRAVAMEIVDGEMETLAAGEWRAYPQGTGDYPVSAGAAKNLPPGRFLLTVEAPKLKLEWRPSTGRHGGPVVREVTLR